MGITGGGLVVGPTRDAAKLSGGQVCSIAKANECDGPRQVSSLRIDVEVTYHQQAFQRVRLIISVKCFCCRLQGKVVIS